MQHIVEKYDGMIDYYENNNVFYADILLKHAKQEGKPIKQENAVDF